MNDQCKHCVNRGDLKACMAETCGNHESWYAKQLQSRTDTLELALSEISALTMDKHDQAGYIAAEALCKGKG